MPHPHSADESPAPSNFIVTIPARDEERVIENTLRALFRQTGSSGKPLPPGDFAIILLADNCSDSTADIARSLGRDSPFPLRVVERNSVRESQGVGSARKVIMDMAGEMLARGNHPLSVIATTDADTLVALDWVTRTRDAFTPEVAAVAGLVEVDFSGVYLSSPAIADYQRSYESYEQLRCDLAAKLEPVPHEPCNRHSIHTGASFAVRAEVYREIGGMPPLKTGEDIAFYRKLLSAGHLVRHAREVRVRTSGRESGRVTGGLSDALGGWRDCAEARGVYMVEAPEILADHYATRARIREIFPSQADVAAMVGRLDLKCFTEADAIALLGKNPPLELFMDELESARSTNKLRQPISYDEALAQFEWLISRLFC